MDRKHEQELESIINDTASKIPSKYRKRMIRMKWTKRGTLRKITKIQNMVKNTDDYEDTVTTRMAAAYILNSYWGIKLFHWILWRLMWDKYSDEELSAICEMGKKKVQAREYYKIMILQIGLRDTLQQMTREEVEAALRGHQSEQKG